MEASCSAHSGAGGGGYLYTSSDDAPPENALPAEGPHTTFSPVNDHSKEYQALGHTPADKLLDESYIALVQAVEQRWLHRQELASLLLDPAADRLLLHPVEPAAESWLPCTAQWIPHCSPVNAAHARHRGEQLRAGVRPLSVPLQPGQARLEAHSWLKHPGRGVALAKAQWPVLRGETQ